MLTRRTPPQRKEEEEGELLRSSQKKGASKGCTAEGNNKPPSSLASFWAIADVHAAGDYVEGADPRTFCTARSPAQPAAAGRIGTFNCDPPAAPQNSVLHSLRGGILQRGGDDGDAKFAVYLGDSSTLYSEHPKPRDVAADAAAEAENFAFVAKTLAKELSVPVFPTLGNHDHSPADAPMEAAVPRDAEFLRRVASMWQESFGIGADAAKTVSDGGFYAAKSPVKGLEVVSLNTLACWNTAVPGLTNETLRDALGVKMMAWFGAQLERIHAQGDRALVIGHIPPAFDSTSLRPMWTTACQMPFTKLVAEYGESTISAMLFGHVHLDIFSVIRDIKGEPVGTALLVPSLTPRASSKPPMSGQNEGKNPSVSRFYLGKDLTAQDFDVYWADLNEANAAGTVTWRKLYSALSEYSLSSLKPSEFAHLSERLATDRATFCAFLRHLTTMQPFPQCESQCRKLLVCSTRSASPVDVVTCLKTAQIPEFEKC